METILKDKTFPEPRLTIFYTKGSGEAMQGLITAEKGIILDIDDFSICEAILSLLALYFVLYVSYPKSLAASSTLLFFQEILLEQQDTTTKKTAKYKSFINYILTLLK